jgi:hypothetical protein
MPGGPDADWRPLVAQREGEISLSPYFAAKPGGPRFYVRLRTSSGGPEAGAERCRPRVRKFTFPLSPERGCECGVPR